MRKARVRAVILTMLCILMLCPPVSARSRKINEVSFGHPNGTLYLASVRIGGHLFVALHRPVIGFGIMLVRPTPVSVTQSTLQQQSVSRPHRTDGR